MRISFLLGKSNSDNRAKEIKPSVYSLHRTLFCVLIFIVLGSYHFVMVSRQPDNLGFYNLLEDSKYGPYGDLAMGFLAGHVYLLPEPEPALKACPNPYLPEVRGAIPVYWDYSYYKGRYFLYFGPVPALTVDIPWHFVSRGCFPSEQAIAFIYVLLNQLFFFLLIRGLVIHYFNGTPIWLETVIYLMYGFSNFVFYIESRSTVYEVAIAAAAAYLAACLYFVFRSIISVNWGWAWLALASLSAGLGSGCRPTLLFLYPILGLFWAYQIYANSPRRVLLNSVALFLPAALCCGAMGWYNYERFDDVLNFGIGYQMNSGVAYNRANIVPSLIPDGIWDYYFSPWTLGGDFPYIALRSNINIPWIFVLDRPRQDYTGLFLSFPVDFIAFIVPYYIFKISNRTLTVFASVVIAWTMVIGLLICSFRPIVARYEVEIQIPILYCVAIGLLAYRQVKLISIPYRALLFMLFGYSTFFGLLWGVIGEDYWLCRAKDSYTQAAQGAQPVPLKKAPASVGSSPQSTLPPPPPLTFENPDHSVHLLVSNPKSVSPIPKLAPPPTPPPQPTASPSSPPGPTLEELQSRENRLSREQVQIAQMQATLTALQAQLNEDFQKVKRDEATLKATISEEKHSGLISK